MTLRAGIVRQGKAIAIMLDPAKLASNRDVMIAFIPIAWLSANEGNQISSQAIVVGSAGLRATSLQTEAGG